MNTLISDFHIHSKYSHDSMSSPENILKYASKSGLERIAIADHRTIRGSVEAKKLSKKYNIEVIISSEVNTSYGDIIGIYLTDEIKSFEWSSVIDEIKSQGGMSILPHPYREHPPILKEVVEKVDYIEVWNSKCSVSDNKMSESLATMYKKKITCGSDAHCVSDIGLVKYPTDLTHYTIKYPCILNQTPLWSRKKSRIICRIKKSKLLETIKYYNIK